MLIALQRPDATLVAGFHRWRELHRWVRKGEAGIAILAPMVVGKKSKDDAANDQRERTEARTLLGFRVVYIFDVSQTEGKELPEFATMKGDPGENLARLEDIVRARGIDLAYEEQLGGALGKSEGGKITLLSSLSKVEAFTTLAHELAHELLHRGDRRQETTKVVRETEAEAVAYVVAKSIGLDPSTQSSDYIQLYSGDEQLLLQSLELIRKVASDILAELDAPVAQEVAHVA
jgi:antirestriction protein ArdC